MGGDTDKSLYISERIVNANQASGFCYFQYLGGINETLEYTMPHLLAFTYDARMVLPLPNVTSYPLFTYPSQPSISFTYVKDTDNHYNLKIKMPVAWHSAIIFLNQPMYCSFNVNEYKPTT